MKRMGVVAILFLAFCGLADSAYILESEKTGTPLLCNIQNLSGCNIVANSQYSHIFGISLSEYGVMFYALLFVLAALELVLFDRFLRRVIQVLSFMGFIGSLYFAFVQVFLIRAICIYCAASGIITVFVLILASKLEPLRKKSVLATPSTSIPDPSPHLPMPPLA